MTQEQKGVFSPYWCSERVFLLTSGKLNCPKVGSEGSDLQAALSQILSCLFMDQKIALIVLDIASAGIFSAPFRSLMSKVNGNR